MSHSGSTDVWGSIVKEFKHNTGFTPPQPPYPHFPLNPPSKGLTEKQVEPPDAVLPQKIEIVETRIGLCPETIDKDAYREFMRGL